MPSNAHTSTYYFSLLILFETQLLLITTFNLQPYPQCISSCQPDVLRCFIIDLNISPKVMLTTRVTHHESCLRNCVLGRLCYLRVTDSALTYHGEMAVEMWLPTCLNVGADALRVWCCDSIHQYKIMSESKIMHVFPKIWVWENSWWSHGLSLKRYCGNERQHLQLLDVWNVFLEGVSCCYMIVSWQDIC